MFQFFRWFQRVKFGGWSVALHDKYAEFFLFMAIYDFKRDIYICLERLDQTSD